MADSLRLTIEPPLGSPPGPAAITIGVFDGVHLGHRHLIGRTVERARALGARAVAVTFDPHPLAVVGRGESVQYLTDLPERKALIRQLGVDAVATLHFTREVAGLSPEAFLDVVKTRLGLVELWVGPDFALGRGRSGTVPVLRQLGGEMGFAVHTIEPLTLGGSVVSSSAIRRLLAAGEVASANRLLGRSYVLEGIVQMGDQRGRLLGFPTANLALDPKRVAPADGVYVVTAVAQGGHLPAVANIGVRPSFGASERRLEVYILGFSGDLYGQHLRVEFHERLRPERRFPDIAELQAQMRRDVERAEEYHREAAANRPAPSPER